MTDAKTDKRIELEKEAKALGVKGRLPFQDASLIAKINKAKDEQESKKAEVMDNTMLAEVPETIIAEPVKEEVAEVTKTEPTPKRKVAPRMSVSGINSDERTKTVERLEREDPDCKYVFQNSSISDADLLAKGLERTGITVKNDCVCRTQKDSYEEVLAAKNQGQLETMQRVDSHSEGIVSSHEPKAKTPKS